MDETFQVKLPTSCGRETVRDVPALAWTVTNAYTQLPSVGRRDAVGSVCA